jgi:hypothetical protein
MRQAQRFCRQRIVERKEMRHRRKSEAPRLADRGIAAAAPLAVPLPSEAPPAPTGSGLTLRQAVVAIACGLVCVVLVAIAIRYSEMVSGQYISNGVPPLPAFAALLVLSVSRPFLQRFAPRLAPNRAQILLIYSMLTVSVILSGLYHVRAMLPHLIAMQYWGTRDSPLALRLTAYSHYLPSWYAPHDPKAIKDYYEGTSSGGHIPWSVWLPPLVWWSLFLLALFLGIFSLVTLVQRQWMRNERLSFPLLAIPLALTSGDWSSYGSVRSRRTLFLLGLGLAAAFNGINITHVLWPSIPSPGFEIPFRPLFPNRPWTPLQDMRIIFFLESIGIGYFVPLDVSFSIWFFYCVNRVLAIWGVMRGYDLPGFPFVQEQCAGGYLAMGLILLFGLRRSFGESLRRSFRRGALEAGAPAERWAWIGLIGSIVTILGFCAVAGLSLWLALPFFTTLGLFILVYARIRAETGVPFSFVFPEGMSKEVVINTLSVPSALQMGGERSVVLLSSFGWLSRFQHPMEEAAYQTDSVKLAEQARIPYGILFVGLLLAFLVGLWAAYWVHLSAYYAQGSNLIASAGGFGEYRESLAHGEFNRMASRLASPPPRDLPRLWATTGGFGLVCLLSLLRRQWFGCPLHPLGFLVANAYGDSTAHWFPMLIAWASKGLILRVGGLKLYRSAIPFFLGLAIGHLLIGGLLWPLFSLTIARAAANAYHLVFGE